MIKRLEHLTHDERARQMRLFSLNKRKLRGILAVGGNEQEEARPFSVAPTYRTRRNEQIFLNMGKLFYCEDMFLIGSLQHSPIILSHLPPQIKDIKLSAQ
ncbi:hypothetical protein QYF61_019852, partial [Mycteria americana]